MGSCPIGTLQESAYGASIADVSDDVTWLLRHTCDVTIFKVVALAQYAFQNYNPEVPDQLSV